MKQTFDFGSASHILSNGGSVSRLGWEKGLFISFYFNQLTMFDDSDYYFDYSPTIEDVKAEDWFIYTPNQDDRTQGEIDFDELVIDLIDVINDMGEVRTGRSGESDMPRASLYNKLAGIVFDYAEEHGFEYERDELIEEDETNECVDCSSTTCPMSPSLEIPQEYFDMVKDVVDENEEVEEEDNEENEDDAYEELLNALVSLVALGQLVESLGEQQEQGE